MSTLLGTDVQGLNQTVEHFEPWAELPNYQREIRSSGDVDAAARVSATASPATDDVCELEGTIY